MVRRPAWPAPEHLGTVVNRRVLRAELRGRDDALELCLVARRSEVVDADEDHELAILLEDVHDPSCTRGQRGAARRCRAEMGRAGGAAPDVVEKRWSGLSAPPEHEARSFTRSTRVAGSPPSVTWVMVALVPT